MDYQEYDLFVKKIKLTDLYLNRLQRQYRNEVGMDLRFCYGLSQEDQDIAANEIIKDMEDRSWANITR